MSKVGIALWVGAAVQCFVWAALWESLKNEMNARNLCGSGAFFGLVAFMLWLFT